MTKTIGVIAIKGGVGKTTVSAALATDLANHYGKKVLLVDANFSAPNLGLHMDILEPEKTIHHVLDRKIHAKSAIQEKFGVDVIPGEYIYNKSLPYLKLKDRLRPLKENYDFIIIDSSPSLNDEVLSTMLASDALFVVTTPDYPTLSCTLKAAKLAKQRGKPIAGIIINKTRDPKYELNLREIEDSLDIPVVAKIPDDKQVIRSIFSRVPVPLYKKNSPFSQEINRLNAALTQNKEKKSFLQALIPFDFNKERINREILKKSFYTNTFQH
ncbi:MAG: MinD/ParA family protein [Nanoarchaeota archaeon]|nr:MinD/ParA family protein [Nanoarchaeota archaeon]MBU0978084.1 MinD/ParA family protein [Nanoarchaeota archaeon]